MRPPLISTDMRFSPFYVGGVGCIQDLAGSAVNRAAAVVPVGRPLERARRPRRVTVVLAEAARQRQADREAVDEPARHARDREPEQRRTASCRA